jgi:hypothetical protein
VLQADRGEFLFVKERVFKYCLSRAGRYICVRCTLKICTYKWRTSHRPLDFFLYFAEDTVKTYCLLHNFVHEQYGYNLEDTSTVRASNDMPVIPLLGRTGNNIHDQYTSYFIPDEDQVC